MNGHGDFSIGSGVWSGISKLIEEAGEVTQVCGKLIAIAGAEQHWDGTDLRDRLEEEIADLMAACDFVIERNKLDADRIGHRRALKHDQFWDWDKEQTSAPCSTCGRVAMHQHGCPKNRCASCGGTTEHANGCPVVKERGR